MDRIVAGTTWGIAIAYDTKRRNQPKWERIRRRELGPTVAPASSNLERSIAALSVAHPEYIATG